MNLLEVLISPLIVVIALVVALLYIRRSLPNLILTTITEWIAEPDNQQAIKEYTDAVVEKARVSVKDTLAGMLSGISRGAKAIEGEIQRDALGVVTGNPVIGGIVSKYISKYPLLGALVSSSLAQGVGSNPPNEQGLVEVPKMQ